MYVVFSVQCDYESLLISFSPSPLLPPSLLSPFPLFRPLPLALPFILFPPLPPLSRLHAQGEEHRRDYPSWAQFIGCLIILSSVLCMPVFLIVRLIFFESGRQEALLFIRTQVRDGERLLVRIKQLPYRTLLFVRSLRLRRQAWSQHSDPVDDSTVSANGDSDPILKTYGTQTNEPLASN